MTTSLISNMSTTALYKVLEHFYKVIDVLIEEDLAYEGNQGVPTNQMKLSTMDFMDEFVTPVIIELETRGDLAADKIPTSVQLAALTALEGVYQMFETLAKRSPSKSTDELVDEFIAVFNDATNQLIAVRDAAKKANVPFIVPSELNDVFETKIVPFQKRMLTDHELCVKVHAHPQYSELTLKVVELAGAMLQATIADLISGDNKQVTQIDVANTPNALYKSVNGDKILVGGREMTVTKFGGSGEIYLTAQKTAQELLEDKHYEYAHVRAKDGQALFSNVDQLVSVLLSGEYDVK